MKLNLNNPYKLCWWKNSLMIRYDDKFNKIILIPCCRARLINYIEPLAWDPEFFINNFKFCINKYKNFDLSNLSKYYFGDCVFSEKDNYPLCNNLYNNHDILCIENGISTDCNLRCTMCLVPHEYNKYKSELYIKVLELLQDLEINQITLTSIGEPFIYKKQTIEFVKNCKCSRIYINTNLILVDENYLKELKNISNNRNIIIEFAVSIDGIDKETYEKIRVGSNFEKIISNLTIANKLGLVHKVHFVKQEENKHQWNLYEDYFKSLGIKNVTSALAKGQLLNEIK